VQSSPEHSRVCLEATQRFWEERTGEHLSDEDAREAIRNVSAFIDLLASWERANSTGAPAPEPEVLR
jgi:hypothetical protein